MTDGARWSLTVSKSTDVAVRMLLAQRGMKKGDLSKFIEESVRRRVFEEHMADARSGLGGMSDDEIMALVDEAVIATRAAHA